MNRHGLSLVLAAILVSTARGEEGTPPDVEGSHDHAVVKRFPGAWIKSFNEKDFEVVNVPVGKEEPKPVEGKLLEVGYGIPGKVSCTQLFRNHENVFKSAGLSVAQGKQSPLKLTSAAEAWGGWPWLTGWGQIKGKGGRIFATAYCSEGSEYLLQVVEAQEMEQKMEITAESLADEISKSGHVALYGINFATGRAEITPDSAKTLEEIGKLLTQKKEWKFRIEGHTDDVGDKKSNLALSKKRAAAVKDWLVKRNGIEPNRLSTEGFGDSKPVAPNDSDENRAKNRRVELVKT